VTFGLRSSRCTTAQSGIGRCSTGTSGGGGIELRIVEIVRQRPGKPAVPGSAEITVHRAQAHLQALRHLALAQPLSEPQAQCLAYLPHRQSLAWHSDPLLLGQRVEPTSG